MSPYRAVVLCLFALFAFTLLAVGTYTADAGAGSPAIDGYGVAGLVGEQSFAR